MRLFHLIILIFPFIACNNDIDLVEEGDEIPVIYGLINSEDSLHVVRVERAFIDEEIAATVLAQDPDEVYFDELTVLFDYLGQSYPLEKVDFAELGIPRDSGFLVSDPNYLYVIEDEAINLSGGNNLEIRVLKNDSLLASAATILVEKPKLLTGNDMIGFRPSRTTSVQWIGNVVGADFFEVELFFYISNDNGEDQLIKWQVGSNIRSDIIRIDGLGFYNFLNAKLEPAPPGTRTVDSIQIILRAAAEELSRYLNVADANTGITGSQEIPIYTNINNGLGLFTSIATDTAYSQKLTAATIDSLQVHPLTEDLGF